MNLTVETSVSKFNESLQAFIRYRRVTVPQALRYQGRLLAGRLIQLTPPISGKSLAKQWGDKLDADVAPLSARKVGERRVEIDIRRVFIGLNNIQEATWQSLGGDQVLRLFSKKDGTVYGVESALFRPDASMAEMAAHHKKHRTKRGRVSMAGTATRDIGRWRFLDKMAVPAEALTAYIKQMKRHVGQAKGGWVAAFRGLGGTSDAQWIRAHISAGSFDEGLNYIRMTNSSEWASGGDEDRIVSNALESRAENMLKAIAVAQEEALKKSPPIMNLEDIQPFVANLLKTSDAFSAVPSVVILDDGEYPKTPEREAALRDHGLCITVWQIESEGLIDVSKSGLASHEIYVPVVVEENVKQNRSKTGTNIVVEKALRYVMSAISGQRESITTSEVFLPYAQPFKNFGTQNGVRRFVANFLLKTSIQPSPQPQPVVTP